MFVYYYFKWCTPRSEGVFKCHAGNSNLTQQIVQSIVYTCLCDRHTGDPLEVHTTVLTTVTTTV